MDYRTTPSVMRKVAFISVAALLILSGCKTHMGFSFRRGHGDVAQVILEESIRRGGTPGNTNNLPHLPGNWYYSQDEYAIALLLPRDQYQTVRDMVKQWYGEPRLGPSEFDDGWLSVYRFSSKGGAMQVGCDREVAFVNIIRPLTSEESAKTLSEAFGDKRFQRALEKSGATGK